MPLKINGETFRPTDSHRQRDATQVAFEVVGRDSGEIRLVDLGEADPAGRYRWRSDGDKLLLQRAGSATPDGEYLWPSAITLAEITKSEVGFKVPINLDSVLAFVGNIIDTVPADVPSVVWLGDGYGPSEEPAGYLAISVNDEGTDSIGYIPFWRGE